MTFHNEVGLPYNQLHDTKNLELLYLFITRESILKGDSDATYLWKRKSR